MGVVFCTGGDTHLRRTQLNTAIDLYVEMARQGLEYVNQAYVGKPSVHICSVSLATYEDKELVRHISTGYIPCEHHT